MGIFTAPNAWQPSDFELYLPYRVRSAQAIARLWRHPSLSGPYGRCDVELDQQPIVAVDDEPQSNPYHLHGVVRLGDGKRVPCRSSYLVPDEDAPNCELSLAIPLGSLARAYTVQGSPYGEANSPEVDRWMRMVEETLMEIAQFVFAEHPFNYAAIGFEVVLPPEPPDEPVDNFWDTILIPDSDGLRVHWRTTPTGQTQPQAGVPVSNQRPNISRAESVRKLIGD